MFVGFASGEELGTMLLRTLGADVWEVFEGMIYVCTFVPIFSGIYSLIIFLKFTFNIIYGKLKQ
ncbi:hypothetical protein C672_1607 [[Clostridium] bifermentans ATCC 638]|uniref:Uncharacterized protein n=2 Tax=Paraclostridium bifermentans TaxID=1490 RepID=T4VMF6_PARBF|nr:hypothetical protein [Paraclostridium bifermentans]EQK42663.1 hypothetical protein C672_1607 [[Clostridium] bifermentans ATCC 638] [Paraclostridium bifermentans ATCC 638 = DSM 14991]RIZ60164.1 hypothetical protein CHH45_04400 [Paraclostridium bifermentans]